ncbi:transposase, partial [Hydrogenibacillus schlegelii]
MLESVVNQNLQAQVQEHLKAEPYERTKERQVYRNVTVTRTLTTRVGRLVLRVRRVRIGQFSTVLFGRFQRSEHAFIIALMEMVVNGVSTRDVAKVTEQLCGTTFS